MAQAPGDTPRGSLCASDRLRALEALVDQAPLGICVLDGEMRYIYVNATLAQMNGVPAADHIGRTVAEVVPHVYAASRERIEQALASETAMLDTLIEGETTRAPGVPGAWLESWYPMGRGEGLGHMIGVLVRDVTREREIAALLRQRELEWRQLADLMPQLVWIADGDGRLQFFNRQWCDFTAATQEDAGGDGWLDFVHPEDRALARARWDAAMRTSTSSPRSPTSCAIRWRRSATRSRCSGTPTTRWSPRRAPSWNGSARSSYGSSTISRMSTASVAASSR